MCFSYVALFKHFFAMTFGRKLTLSQKHDRQKYFVYNFTSEIEIDIGICMINRQSVTLFHRKPASSISHFLHSVHAFQINYNSVTLCSHLVRTVFNLFPLKTLSRIVRKRKTRSKYKEIMLKCKYKY